MSDFFLGCDASKGYADFVVINQREEVVEKVFQLDDTFEGHSKLFEFLSAFFKSHENAVMYAGMESTGGYENNWYAYLQRLGDVLEVKVTRLNPLAVKRHHEASLKRNVTDDISAINIASYLVAYRNRISYDQDSSFSSLRRQWNLTRLFIKQKTQLANQLGFLIYQSHPEMVRYCRHGIPDWALQLLAVYPTAAKLARAKKTSVEQIPYISAARAQRLIDDARHSIACHGDDTDEFIIKETVRQIMNLNTAIALNKKHMEANCTMPEVQQLCSIKGVGIHSAIGLMIIIVSIKRFPNVKKLASFLGLHPVYKQSGDGEWGFHMSKQGNSEARAILYMVVLSAVIHNPIIKNLYKRCRKNGMERMAAIGVCMHKMLRIIYGMLKTNTAFEPAIDEKNTKPMIATNAAQRHFQVKRRLQQPDMKAPISKRQTKARRKQNGGIQEPQKDKILENGVIPTLRTKNITIDIDVLNRRADLTPISDIINNELAEIAELCHD